jgi:hypothetical protein
MSPDQKAKMEALDRQARLHHIESMQSLNPLINPDPDASAFVRFLNSSSIPGSP